MSNLSAFLHPVQTNLEKEVVISPRFVKRGEDGEPVLDKDGNTIPEAFKIRALTQEENDQMIRASTKVEIRNGQRVSYLDDVEYTRRIVVGATVYPDFKSAEMCSALDVASPLLCPVKMLFSGEYKTLVSEIMELSGFEQNATEELVKN